MKWSLGGIIHKLILWGGGGGAWQFGGLSLHVQSQGLVVMDTVNISSSYGV